MHDKQQSDEDFANELPDDLNQFASRLADFRPQASRADRDRILFEAGRAAADRHQPQSTISKRTLRYWQIATISSSTAAVSACLWLVLILADRGAINTPLANKPGDVNTNNRSTTEAKLHDDPIKAVEPSNQGDKGSHDSLPSSTILEQQAKMSRIQATQLALALNIDSKIGIDELWPDQTTRTTNGMFLTDRVLSLRPLSLLNDDAAKQMIAALNGETQP